MKIRYHPHAVLRMQERGVTVAMVELIVKSPDGKIMQSKEKVIYYKRIKGRRDNLVAAVVVELSPGDFVDVVTVLVNFEVRV